MSGEWILTTSQSGQNFNTGNNPTNRTGAYTVVPFVNPLPGHEEQDFRAMAERMSGRSMDDGRGVLVLVPERPWSTSSEHPASA